MTKVAKITFKKQLFQQCQQLIENRMTALTTAMQNAQAAANMEEKSSAGDKYETARSMNQLDKDMHAKQLAATRKELAALLSISTSSLHATVMPGSVVVSDASIFYIAAGLGKINFQTQTVYLLSPLAPMAKLLLGKQKGNHVVFNKNELVILDCY